MNRPTEEALIRKWFGMWLDKEKADIGSIDDIFAPDVVYTECYGPQYRGTGQLKRWFSEWNQAGTVLRWDISRIICQDNNYAVEWYFECDYEGAVSGFDGVSLISFSGERIIRLSEFQSKAEHIYPYK